MYTTRAAARLLGVSVPTVQQLVETGAIAAWKTAGGHRRIPESALHNYLRRHLPTESAADTADGSHGGPKCSLVMSSDAQTIQLCEAALLEWRLPLSLIACPADYDALLTIGLRRPDIVVMDLDGDGLDAHKALCRIVSNPELSGCQVAALATASSHVDAFSGLPARVACFYKPIDLKEFRGYLTACCLSQLRKLFPELYLPD